MAKKVFITGGSGFVGQNIIPELIKAGYEVLALARSSKAAEKVQQVGARSVMDDLTDLSHNTIEALKQCDIVVHSAAYMEFNYEKAKFYSINVDATKHLLKLAQANGIARFIYISAAPVVPGSPIINITEDEAKDGLPKDLYPKTKAIAERAVLAANSKKFITTAIRPPAIWGPDNHHMSELLDRVKAGQWRWIGGSHQILSTIHIKNLAAATIAAIQNSKGGKAYFVTDGDRRSMRTTFDALIKAYGFDPGDKEISFGLAASAARLGDFIWKLFGLKSRPPVPPLAIRLMAREFSVSDRKARKELKYENVISFEEGIQAMKNQSL